MQSRINYLNLEQIWENINVMLSYFGKVEMQFMSFRASNVCFLVLAALILGSVILAARNKWNWAFALLALATMFKFFPVVLVIPFLIAQQKHYSDKWYSWQRWSALVLYCGICILATLLSFSLNIANTINPFLYFFNRPIQVESAPATIVWLGTFWGYPFKIIQSFGSVN